MLQWMGNESGDDAAGTILRDVILFCFGVVAAVLVMILPHINEPESKDEESRRRGNIRVEVIWDQSRDIDVDLWCKAPGDMPVGYSNTGGRVFNLLRDDLGHTADFTGINYEVAFTRGLPAGEYIINLHYYRGEGGRVPGGRGSLGNAPGQSRMSGPISVKVLITIKKNDTADSKETPQKILSTTVELKRVGDEITVVRFKLDKNKDLIKDSINTVQMNLRSKNGDAGI